MRLSLIFCLALGAPALAQEDFELPNPLRLQNLAATCNGMAAQIRATDPRAVQVLIGVWQGNGMVPGVQGYYPDAPAQTQVTFSADGSMLNQTYACIRPFAGGEFCNTSNLVGEWAAHFTPEGYLAVPASSSGTGISGAPLPTSCGISFLRLIDQNTMQAQDGTVLRRVR
jgi:hypothetical protein